MGAAGSKAPRAAAAAAKPRPREMDMSQRPPEDALGGPDRTAAGNLARLPIALADRPWRDPRMAHSRAPETDLGTIVARRRARENATHLSVSQLERLLESYHRGERDRESLCEYYKLDPRSFDALVRFCNVYFRDDSTADGVSAPAGWVSLRSTR